MKLSSIHQVLLALALTMPWAGVLADDSSSDSNSNTSSQDSSSSEDTDTTTTTTTMMMIFDTGNRQSGWTYEESFDMDMTTTITMMGQTMDMTITMQLDSETTAEDLPQGGQTVHFTIERLAYTANTGMINLSCDTASVPRNEADDVCDGFYDLVTDMTFVVDDEGHIAESSAEDELVKSSGAADQLQATARLLGFIPKHPIQVGESWDSSMDLDGLGYFEGTSKFLGLDKDLGCAIVSTVGDLDIDFQALMEKMGDQMQGMAEEDVQILDSRMAAKTCWDNEAKMMAWSQTDMSFELHMPNPLDEENELVMPVTEVIKTTCKVKEQN